MKKIVNIQAQIESLLEKKGLDHSSFAKIIKFTHPADFAYILEDLDEDDQLKLFQALSPTYAAQILQEVDEDTQYYLIKNSQKDFISRVLALLPPDEGADLVNIFEEEEEGEEILSLLREEKVEEIKQLSSYEPDSAGGIMTSSFFTIPADINVEQVIKLLQNTYEIEDISFLYVIDESNHLEGILPLKQLLRVPPKTSVRKIMQKDFINANVSEDKEDVAQKFNKYGLRVMPVIDDEHKLIGVITFDDIIEVMQDEASEDIYKLAGTDVVHPAHDSIARRVILRVPWLIPTMLAETIVAQIIKSFESQLASKMIILVLFVPILMATSGAVGNQSSTLVVRGLATGEIALKRFAKVFISEVTVGFLIGILCAIAVSIISYIMFKDLNLGFVIGIAMVLAVSFSCTLGSILPLLLSKLKIDPAVSSTPFISCFSDILSTTLYLYIANMLLINVI